MHWLTATLALTVHATWPANNGGGLVAQQKKDRRPLTPAFSPLTDGVELTNQAKEPTLRSMAACHLSRTILTRAVGVRGQRCESFPSCSGLDDCWAGLDFPCLCTYLWLSRLSPQNSLLSSPFQSSVFSLLKDR